MYPIIYPMPMYYTYQRSYGGNPKAEALFVVFGLIVPLIFFVLWAMVGSLGRDVLAQRIIHALMGYFVVLLAVVGACCVIFALS